LSSGNDSLRRPTELSQTINSTNVGGTISYNYTDSAFTSTGGAVLNGKQEIGEDGWQWAVVGYSDDSYDASSSSATTYRATGALLDEFADFVAVARARFEEREDQELSTASFPIDGHF
jgi:hypothetical protein